MSTASSVSTVTKELMMIVMIFTSLCVFCLPYEYYITTYTNQSQQQIENILDSFLNLYKPHLGVFRIDLNTFTLMGLKRLYGAYMGLKRAFLFVVIVLIYSCDCTHRIFFFDFFFLLICNSIKRIT